MGVFGRGQVPQWVQNLATHRHLGLDILLITQSPMLVDSFVRSLGDRHFHIVRKFGTWYTTIHEFTNGIKDNVLKSRSGSVKHSWRFQKEVFGWYTSAEKHTVKRRIPLRVLMIPVLIAVFAAASFVAYTRLNPDAARAQVEKSTGTGTGSTSVGGGQPGHATDGRSGPMTTAEYAQAYQARVQGLPHTAPIYDDVTKPVAAPYPAACVAIRGECRCYSQQGTRLDVPMQICTQIVAGGFFIAWDKPVVAAVSVSASSPGGPGDQQVVAQATGIVGVRPPVFTDPLPAVNPDLGAPPRVRPPPRGAGS